MAFDCYPTEHAEPIIIRNRVVWAELIYISGRNDYKVYRHNSKTYVVRLEEGA